MKPTKKAQISTTIKLIIVVISAIIILLLLNKINQNYGNQGAIEICRTSVLSQAKITIGMTSPLSLECKRRFVDIYPDHVATGYEPDKTKKVNIYSNGKKINQYKEPTSDIVNYVVAEEMRICWYQFGESKTEIFPNNEAITEGIGTSDDDICFICSEIEFIDIKNKEYTGLINYLKENYPKDAKYTYWEYLNQESLSEYTLEEYIEKEYTDKIEELWNNKKFIFKSDQTYAVIFYKDFDSFIKGKSGYYVLVLPTKNLDNICEIQAS